MEEVVVVNFRAGEMRDNPKGRKLDFAVNDTSVARRILLHA